MNTAMIGRRRLVSQRVVGEKLATPAAVVKWMGAMQAQDYNHALWAIGLRTPSATLADVEGAIADGKIVRTWPMRGTIHFVPAQDARWMLELMASRVLAGLGRRRQQLELTPEIIGHSRDVFCAALSGGQRLTRAAMLAVLEDAGIRTEGQRGYHILSSLSQEGILCMGPVNGKQQTFVLLDEWVPRSRQLTREEALAELATRFFTSHGPATVHDFARWTGLTVADSRLGLELAKSALTAITIDDTAYWLSEDTLSAADDAGDGVYLLPAFDEYVIGYKDRSVIVEPEHEPKIVPGNNGMFLPTLVIDGQVVGLWKRAVKKKVVDITFHPFTDLGDREQAVLAAVQPYADFVELPAKAAVINA